MLKISLGCQCHSGRQRVKKTMGSLSHTHNICDKRNKFCFIKTGGIFSVKCVSTKIFQILGIIFINPNFVLCSF